MGKRKRAKEQSDLYDNGNEIRSIEKQIQSILMDKEVYWKQRSMADWLKARDKNTKIFHAKASLRKRKNRIEGVKYNAGNWLKGKGGCREQIL